MKTTAEINDVNNFVDAGLEKNGFQITLITEEALRSRLAGIMEFVNRVIREYKDEYGWKTLGEDYFTNPLVDKFKYSFLIQNMDTEEICFLNFSSIYGDILHNHCTYAGSGYRGLNLAKYHLLKLCNTALEHNIPFQEGYWPKHNNGSIILYLKMGWKIEEIRKNNTQLYMVADNAVVSDTVLKMLRANS